MTGAQSALLRAILALAVLLVPATAYSDLQIDNRRIEVRPPVGTQNGWAYMNCGWHPSCLSPYSTDGPGVDWDDGASCCNQNPRYVYFRNWAYRAGLQIRIGSLTVKMVSNQPCNEIHGEVKIYETGQLLGTYIFQHASRSSTVFTAAIYGSTAGTWDCHQFS
jgi:hypothetical protein